MLRRHCVSAEKRLNVPGTPCSTQLADVLIAGLAVCVQAPEVKALCVTASKFADWRVRLVKLML